MSFISKAAMAAALVLFASSAQAATYSFSGPTGYVTGTKTTNFNINSLWNGTDTIVDARVRVTLTDDGDRRLAYTTQHRVAPFSRTTYETQTYSCGILNHRTCTRTVAVTRPVYNYRTGYHYRDEPESTLLTIGDQSNRDSTPSYITGSGFDTDLGYRGSMFVSLVLNAANLADLATDGRITSRLDLLGDARITSYQLRVTTRPGGNPTDVPLPASALLLLGGLAGLEFMRRRRS